jgi:hypothetical protein
MSESEKVKQPPKIQLMKPPDLKPRFLKPPPEAKKPEIPKQPSLPHAKKAMDESSPKESGPKSERAETFTALAIQARDATLLKRLAVFFENPSCNAEANFLEGLHEVHDSCDKLLKLISSGNPDLSDPLESQQNPASALMPVANA